MAQSTLASSADRSALGLFTHPVSLRAAGVIAFTALAALSAQVAFPVPGTPVPQTLQTLVVVGAGLTLGMVGGTASMALYIALGVLGVPFFADGSGGWQVILGATGGYLVGFVACQPIVRLGLGPGAGAERERVSWARIALTVLAAYGVIFLCGVPWLKLVSGESWAWAIQKGLQPFLLGAAVKIAGTIALAPAMLRARRFFT